MQKGFPPEHRTELVGNSFEELLDGRSIAYKSARHFQA